MNIFFLKEDENELKKNEPIINSKRGRGILIFKILKNYFDKLSILN